MWKCVTSSSSLAAFQLPLLCPPPSARQETRQLFHPPWPQLRIATDNANNQSICQAEAENSFRLPRSGHRWVWQEEAKRKRTGNRHQLKMLKMQKRKGEKEEFQKRSGSRLQKMKSTKKTAKNWVSTVQQGLGQKNGEKWGGIDSWWSSQPLIDLSLQFCSRFFSAFLGSQGRSTILNSRWFESI